MLHLGLKLFHMLQICINLSSVLIKVRLSRYHQFVCRQIWEERESIKVLDISEMPTNFPVGELFYFLLQGASEDRVDKT